MAADSYFDSRENGGANVLPDPFYTRANLEKLDESDRQIREGKVIVKAMEELEAMELE